MAIRRLFSKISLIVIGFFLATPPASALRIQGPRDGSIQEELLSGLEEPPAAPFRRLGHHILVRNSDPNLADFSGDYSLLMAGDLHRMLGDELKNHMKKQYGLDSIPLVYLPEISDAFGKPVYLWRAAAVLPTGSWKPFLTAALIDLYSRHQDKKYNLTGYANRTPPEFLYLQTTGNQGNMVVNWLLPYIAGMAAIQEDIRETSPPVPVAHIYTARDISSEKRRLLESDRSVVKSNFADYGEAQDQLLRDIKSSDGRAMYIEHGNRMVVASNMVGGMMLEEAIQGQHGSRDGLQVAVVLPAGAGGGCGGFSAYLSQRPGFILLLSETQRVPPVFRALEEGNPVRIALPPGLVTEGGIGVSSVEGEALRVLRASIDAIGRVDHELADQFTWWVMQQLQSNNARRVSAWQTNDLPYVTEGVTGMSAATLFLMQERGLFDQARFSELDIVVIVESGINAGPDELGVFQRAGLPLAAQTVSELPAVEGAMSGMEEVSGAQYLYASP